MKEGYGYPLTRFEVKLQSAFFTKNRLNLFAGIMKALSKYHVMYVPNKKEKQRLMDEYDIRENNIFESHITLRNNISTLTL